MSDVLTISEVAKRSGVAPSALRFYEDQRLIHSERASSGHRRYARSVLRLIAFIVFAQKVGLSLEEIRAELAKLPQHRVPERADWAKLSGEWRSRIRERIAELDRLEAGLTLDRCAMANPGDRAARRGAGPRYWMDGRNGQGRW
jgi:MerR family redox-sensitive transcriptional activator SoxR